MFIARSEYGKFGLTLLSDAVTNCSFQIAESSMKHRGHDIGSTTNSEQHLFPGRTSIPGRILSGGYQARFNGHWCKLDRILPETSSSESQVATSEGVVLGVEKRVTSTLLETSSVEKIVEIDRHIGCAMSGLQADARSMVEHARVTSQNHAFHYDEKLRVESCTQAICDLALRFGEGAEGEESVMSRPFGVALLIAGYDEDGPSLSVLPIIHIGYR